MTELKKKKSPALRFPEFTDDWEQCKLGEDVSLENGYSYKSEYFQVEQSKYILLTPGNVIEGGGFQGDKGRNYSSKGPMPEKFVFKPNDIFVTMTDLTPTAQTLGYAAIIPDDGNVYLHNQRLGKLKSDTLNFDFLITILATDDYHREIVSGASGTTVKHTSPSKILDYKYMKPSYEEQMQIGKFFDNIDNLINLHKRKLDLLKEQKKGFLQNMFPKREEKTPKLRFKGFSDNWRFCKLREVISTDIKGKTKSEMAGTESPYLETNYLNGGRISYVDSPKNVEQDDVLILWDGSQAGTVYHGFEGALGSTLKAYKPKESGEFLYQQLKKSQQVIYDRYRTPNIPHVIKTFTDEFWISMTDVTEQKKIGNFFKQLDNIFDLHQRKLNLLKEQKKAFLQKMFL